MYIQYKEYIGFAKCMDALKGKKLVMKESDGKALAATIKVEYYAACTITLIFEVYCSSNKDFCALKVHDSRFATNGFRKSRILFLMQKPSS